MRITKNGIEFQTNNDFITWRWWWKRAPYVPKYQSAVYAMGFSSMKDYWMHVGRSHVPLPIPKVHGTTMYELARCWAQIQGRCGSYVLMLDVNVEFKPASFWRSIPDGQKAELTKDVVVLTCKDYQEAQALCQSVDTSFAKAFAVVDGQILDSNIDFTNDNSTLFERRLRSLPARNA